ncbi:MAG: hypothetical protein WBD22_10520 [Pyrinomonadaceae bacterium]
MNELAERYEVTKKDLATGRNLKIAAWSAPLLLSFVPAILFAFLFVAFGTTPPAAASILFFGVLFTLMGLLLGFIASVFFAFRRSQWTKEMRERIAADGIRAEEIDWFRHELNAREIRSLRSLEKYDLLMADAYRETLASRLTASRIIRSSKSELTHAKRRQNDLKRLESENVDRFRVQAEDDVRKINSINTEAKQMLVEAESRLQMIEAASMRGGHLADSELALKKLSARSKALPLALEAARMHEEIRREIEAGSAEESNGGQ